MTEAVLEYTAGELIRSALKQTRRVNVDQPIQGKDINNGLEALNFILKHLQAQDLHLWKKEEAIIPLVTGQRKYLLGPGGDNVARANSFLDTTLSADEIAAAVLINVDDLTGVTGAAGILLVDPVLSTQGWTATNSGVLSISSGLKITNGGAGASTAEFELDTTVGNRYVIEVGYTVGTSASATLSVFDTAGTLDTTTETVSDTYRLEFTARDTVATFSIANVDVGSGDDSTVSSLQYYDRDSGDYVGVRLDDDTRFWSRALFVTTVIEIADGLPSGATTGNTVYTYTDNIERPERVLQTRFGENLTASEIPTNQWSREEYFDQPDKDSTGTVVQWYNSTQLGNSELYVWQVAANSDQVLRLTYSRPMYISSDIVDSVDIPSEWVLPLVWRLASDLGPQYGVPLDRQAILDAKAGLSMEEVLGHDVERDSMDIQPDFH